MEIQVDQQELSEALALVARASDAKGTLPIIGNILMRTEKSRLVLSATNLEIAVTLRIAASVRSEGAVTIPARITQEFVGSLPKGSLEIQQKDNKVSIVSGTYSSNVNSVAAEDFPSLPAVDRTRGFTVPTSEMRSVLEQVVFSASNDESRPVLTGVLFTGSADAMTVAATDSYRLAERTIAVAAPGLEALIPASSLQTLQKILGKKEMDVHMFIDDTQALFVVDDVELITRLVDGSYPEYKGLIPEDSETTFTMKKDELLRLTKLASLFARETAGSITIEVNSGEQQVYIRSVASQVGENSSHATALIEGQDGRVTLNSRFLIDALNALTSDELSFGFSANLSPCVIKPVGETSGNYRQIVMPLKG